jgi:hypothetical protein
MGLAETRSLEKAFGRIMIPGSLDFSAIFDQEAGIGFWSGKLWVIGAYRSSTYIKPICYVPIICIGVMLSIQ